MPEIGCKAMAKYLLAGFKIKVTLSKSDAVSSHLHSKGERLSARKVREETERGNHTISTRLRAKVR